MITKDEAKKVFESKLVKDEKILLFGEQIRPWVFINKFLAVFLFIILIFLTVNFILPLPFIDISYLKDEIVQFTLLIILPEVILLYLFIKNRPFRNFKNKEPVWYYAFTNYRIMYYRKKMMLGNSFYYYELDDILVNVTDTTMLDYKYLLYFKHPSNDNYECGNSNGYRIYVKTKEEVDTIIKIAKEHPNEEDKNYLLGNYYTIPQILTRHLKQFIIVYIMLLISLFIYKKFTSEYIIKASIICFLSYVFVCLIEIVSTNNKKKK